MDWILRNIPLLVFLFVVFQIVRAVMRSRAASAEHEAGHDETEEQRRVREIQERIRRKIAERRGERAPVSTAPPVLEPDGQDPWPNARPQEVPPLDPFGGVGSLKRALAELGRRVQSQAAPPPLVESRSAEIERQERLADEMRALAEARLLAQRRAAQRAATKDDAAKSEPGMRTAARAQLLEELGDPQNLRRAFVLREVLGTPVGLR